MLVDREKVESLAQNLARNMDNPDTLAGRSLWADARRRFLHNKAATVSLSILTVIVLFSLVGQYFAAWSNEEIHWDILGSVAEKGQPSIESGQAIDRASYRV